MPKLKKKVNDLADFAKINNKFIKQTRVSYKK